VGNYQVLFRIISIFKAGNWVALHYCR